MGLLSSIGKIAGAIGLDNLERSQQRRDAQRAMRESVKERKRSLLEDPTFLVRGAIRAGFNPVTVLGATGGASSGLQAPFAPLSRDSSVLNKVAGEIIEDPLDKRRRELENELLEARIRDTRQEADMFGLQGTRESNGPTRQVPPERIHPSETNPLTTLVRQSETRFPVVDPGSTRPEDARIMSGPYAGRYVLYSTGGVPFVSPVGMSPTALEEEIRGGIMSELVGATTTLRGWKRVYVNDRGELVGTKPKARLPSGAAIRRLGRGQPLKLDIF